MSYVGLGLGPVGSSLGLDPGRQPFPGDSRFVTVTATWAQRAANAANRQAGRPLIMVDGRAGPITISALRANAGGGVVENVPATSRITSRVKIGIGNEELWSRLPRVADPRVVSSSVSTPTSTSTASATTSAGPVRSTALTPEGESVMLEEPGPLTGGGGWTPWLIGGGLTLAAIAAFVMLVPRRRASVPAVTVAPALVSRRRAPTRRRRR